MGTVQLLSRIAYSKRDVWVRNTYRGGASLGQLPGFAPSPTHRADQRRIDEAVPTITPWAPYVGPLER